MPIGPCESDDLARVMSAQRVRIIAPIPGSKSVGIELPNDNPSIVYLKNIINSEQFIQSKSKLSISLGKTTTGGSIIGFGFEVESPRPIDPRFVVTDIDTLTSSVALPFEVPSIYTLAPIRGSLDSASKIVPLTFAEKAI